MNLMMLLDLANDAMPDRIALTSDGEDVTYAQLYARTASAAGWLKSRPGDRLLWVDERSVALPVALFSAAWVGRPFVPVSYRLADDRLAPLLERQAPATAVISPMLSARLPEIESIDTCLATEFSELTKGFAPSLNDWSQDADDIALLLHTSGTSGNPKVAVLRHRHLTSYILGSVDFMGAGEDEATLVSVPPYHIAGIAAILSALFAGRRLVQMASFDPHEWVKLAAEQQVTHAMLVPTMLARVIDALAESGDGPKLPNLKHLAYGGGRMPVPVITRAMELLPQVNFTNAYGLTETSSSISVLGPEDHWDAFKSSDPAVRARLGSVGRPLPTVTVQVRGANGDPAQPHERGSIWVRGEQVSGEYSHSQHSHSDDTAPAFAQDEAWFETKDSGYFDDDGFLFVEGRLDDVIVRGGENLSPGEIEDVILAHPDVSEVVAFGLPNEEWGEIVGVSVVLRDGAELSGDDIRSWVVSHLRSSRAPALVDLRTSLPMGDTGKVLRRVLQSELMVRAEGTTR